MAIRIGINGFGRMGRLGLRAGWEMTEWFFRPPWMAEVPATQEHLPADHDRNAVSFFPHTRTY